MADTNNIHVSILGCCVVRDIFRMASNAEEFVVDKYVQSIHPISAVSKPPFPYEGTNYLSVVDGMHNFEKRCFMLDMEKKVFDFMGEAQSDYLLLDMASLRLNLVRTVEGTATDMFKGKATLLEKKKILQQYSLVPFNQLDTSELCAFIDQFLEKVLTLYPQEKIILFEIMPASIFINKYTVRCDYYDKQLVQDWTQALSMGYQYVHSKLPNAMTIPCPEYILGDINHQWGFHPLHYVAEYYDYALEAIKIAINQGLDRESRMKYIENNCRKLSQKMLNTFMQCANITIKYLRGVESKYKADAAIKQKLAAHESDVFDLIAAPEQFALIRDFFIGNNIKTCALYGINALSDFYQKLLKKWGVFITYYVDDMNLPSLNNIPIIKQNNTNLPLVNCMLICVDSSEEIKANLKKIGYTGLITDCKTLAGLNKKEENKA